jgi:hypothetical protein
MTFFNGYFSLFHQYEISAYLGNHSIICSTKTLITNNLFKTKHYIAVQDGDLSKVCWFKSSWAKELLYKALI